MSPDEPRRPDPDALLAEVAKAGFVEAMGGRIAAASPIHDGRGARILISLRKEPVQSKQAPEHA